MSSPPVIEVREPGREPRRVALTRALEVGRDADGLALADGLVSRRHLRLVPSPVALSLVDLGSRNGTLVNGRPVTGRVTLEAGDVVRLGTTEILVVGRPERIPVPAAARATVLAGGAAVALPPPPPPPAVPAAPSRTAALWDRALGRTARPGEELFPVYTEMRAHVPPGAWRAVRVVSLLAYLALVVALFVRPAGGLFVFFGIVVPLLPALFFVAPGLWRNICPLAAANQTPRVLGFTLGRTLPEWFRRRAFVVAMVLFFGIAGARLAVFNGSGTATGVLLAVIIAAAFLGGLLFKGKSGWCSQICPLLPLQRVYGQTPFVRVPNAHCRPCVACTANCYDFAPIGAYQADLHEDDPVWTAPRRLFVAALPGFVLGFFVLAGAGDQPLTTTYGELALFFLGSVGLFYAVSALLPLSPSVAVALWGAAALNLFYWFAAPVLASSFATVTGVSVPWLRWPVSGLVLVLSLLWIARTAVKERQYTEQFHPELLPVVPVSRPAPATEAAPEAGGTVEVRIAGTDAPVEGEVGTSLLETVERAGQPIEAGCRMGVCGADPVAVLEGASCLSEPEEEELSTLRRLGLARNTRMACSARLQPGAVTVSLTPEPGGPDDGEAPREFDRSIVSVVVLGNGIAGVTAADFVRRGHPECEIHVVGQEPHVLYNRMGISRVVYGRSAMQGLSLLPETWYDDHQVTAWLNTVATRIDLESRRVFLGTGEVLPYDRLVLATGSRAVEPPVEGFGRPGSFVLRSAADAGALRAHVQRHGCRDAVVAGGGLLGLEAAHALQELGLRVTVLERGARLLSRQIDPRCSELVDGWFRRIGLQVLYRAEAQALTGESTVTGVRLTDRRALRCDVFLAAVGIRPDVDLAREAGIPVGKGVLVDDRMETAVRGVFAAGDVAEHGGRVWGLWPVAAKQGEVAAVNALGGDERLVSEVPATLLKGVGLDLFAVGRVEPEAGEEVLVDEDESLPSYRRLVVAGRTVVGGVVLGHHPEDVTAVTAAVKRGLELDDAVLAGLRAGDWAVLRDVGRRRPTSQPAPA
ncbi:2Fe-2S iron-sulfur cluster binding domain-containing protein [Geodermatophilus telluris]|uniref:2Fe-2S iron-sulfur cluster binding domain-containing protein n=1 Tax=Geodermatophilus telluris TaxID=1190417 RepID=A0A1G6V6Q5_9ACTN|nr:FAD-dependent oxidoreductase [Geodermatophilus telluris]SDD49063.1 2Fe-2S iron-sulfur cluster binding domain-containing protein [Geodermatophilus telluris]